MDLSVGAKIGFIEILGPPVTMHGKHSYSLVRCICGKEWMVRRDSISRGRVTSCGCQRKAPIKHGMSHSPEYQSWLSIKQRCLNPKSVAWKWYGARGIVICAEWERSFDAFYRDVGPRPEGMSIERKDNSLGYEPGNCRWATRIEQMQNTRGTCLVDLDGERVSMAEAARRLGVKEMVVYHTAAGDPRRGRPRISAQDAVAIIQSKQRALLGTGAPVAGGGQA